MQVAGSAGRQRMRGLQGKDGGFCDRMTYGQRCFTIWYTLWVVVFIIVGAAYTSVWKNDKRAANIAQYNSVVSQFNAQRAAFADVEVNVTLVRLWPPTAANAQPDLSAEDYATWTLGVGPQRLTQYSPTDALADSSAASDGAASYTTLAYAGPSTQQWLPDSLFDKDLQFAYRVNVTSKRNPMKSSLIASSTNGYGAFSPFTVQTLSPQDIGCDTGKYCAQSCVDVGGVWSYPVCTIYYMMTAMCFRVSPHPTEADTWVFDDSFGDGDDGGCGWFQNRFAPGKFEPITYARDTRYPLGTRMRAWHVRLGNDPWTYASWITSGTMNFGTGSPSAKGASIACLLLGFLALGAGMAYAVWARYTGRWTSFSADGILGGGARDGGTLSALEAPSAKRDRDTDDTNGTAADAGADGATTTTTAVMVDDGSQVPSPAAVTGGAAGGGGGPSYSADVAAALADGPLQSQSQPQRPASPNAAEDNGR